MMKTDHLSHHIQNYFMGYLIGQRGYGANTIASYRDTFKLLFSFLRMGAKAVERLGIVDLDKACILDFLRWLEDERRNSVSTRNVRLAHLKSFYGYVLSISPEFAEHCSQIINIPFKKAGKKPPGYLTETETKTLLGLPDGNTRNGLRHMAMLTLLYDSACRVQELIDLSVSDLTLGRICKLHVKGKGDKYREIPLLSATGKLMRQYIDSFALQPEQPLFANRQGKRLTRAGVAYVLDKYSRVAKEQDDSFPIEHMPPHLIRHSKATHLVNHGVSIFSIRDFLGHESISTTQMYLTSNPEVIRDAIENAAINTAADSTTYYSNEETADLLQFLDDLV